MFGFITFVFVCIASACANAYRIQKEIDRLSKADFKIQE